MSEASECLLVDIFLQSLPLVFHFFVFLFLFFLFFYCNLIKLFVSERILMKVTTIKFSAINSDSSKISINLHVDFPYGCKSMKRPFTSSFIYCPCRNKGAVKSVWIISILTGYIATDRYYHLDFKLTVLVSILLSLFRRVLGVLSSSN